MRVMLCALAEPGYLYPALAIGREMARRGHSVHVLTRRTAAGMVTAAGLTPLSPQPSADPGFAVGHWFSAGDRQFEAVLGAARAIRAEVLVTSVLGHGALLAAQVLDRPAVVIGFASHLWAYAEPVNDRTDDTELRRWRTAVTLREYHRLRRRLGLPAPGPGQSPLLGAGLLLRGDSAFEAAGARLPIGARHIGPCTWEPPAPAGELEEITQRVERIGKPLVYVHLGRDFGGESLWPRLNAAFTGTGLQAVVERGRSGPPRPGPGADITMVRKPWMTPLIRRAGLVLANGTSSPVLAALLTGRGLVLAPSGSEQPVLAAACLRAGVAVRLPDEPDERIGATIRAAQADPALAGRVRDLGGRLAAADGPVRAADAVEAAGGSGRPARAEPLVNRPGVVAQPWAPIL